MIRKGMDMGRFQKTKFPFGEPKNTAVITCCHIIDNSADILYVSHDEDGMWQFLCGGTHSTEDARVVALGEIAALDRTVGELASMPLGSAAERGSKSSAWVIKKK